MGRRVLLITQDTRALSMLDYALHHSGYFADAFFSHENLQKIMAEDAVNADRYCAVVVDIEFNQNGSDATKEIRKKYKGPIIPLAPYFMTQQQRDSMNAFEEFRLDPVYKPVDKHSLATLFTILDRNAPQSR